MFAQAAGPGSWKLSSHERSADKFPKIEIEGVVQTNFGGRTKGARS